MKIAVLTSSIGCTKLIDPKPFDGVDYHAFIDYEDDNTSWIKHPVIPFSTDARYKNRRDAKVYKVLPFAFLPNYDYYFWVDSTHILQANPYEVIDTYLKDNDVIYVNAKGTTRWNRVISQFFPFSSFLNSVDNLTTD